MERSRFVFYICSPFIHSSPSPINLFSLLISHAHQHSNLVHVLSAKKPWADTEEGIGKSKLASRSTLGSLWGKAWVLLFMSVLDYACRKDLLNLDPSSSNLLRGTVWSQSDAPDVLPVAVPPYEIHNQSPLLLSLRVPLIFRSSAWENVTFYMCFAAFSALWTVYIGSRDGLECDRYY